VAVLALLSINVQESPPDHDPQPLLAQLTAGLHHLRHTPVLAPIALATAVAFSVIGFFESVDFAVIDQGLHRPPSFYGVLNSVQGAGSILGGLTASLLLRRLREARTVGLALLVDGAGALALTQRQLPVVLAGVVVMGVGIPWLLVGYLTAQQRLTPPRLQGRVAAATNLLTSGPQTASIAAGAGLITILDYRILLLVISTVLLCSGGLLMTHHTNPRQPSTSTARQAGAPDVP
jgi:Transmembrane secretion effector